MFWAGPHVFGFEVGGCMFLAWLIMEDFPLTVLRGDIGKSQINLTFDLIPIFGPDQTRAFSPCAKLIPTQTLTPNYPLNLILA